MSARGTQFFRQRDHETAPGPTIVACDDCELPANPAWRDHGKNYCRFCASPDLKKPTIKEDINAHRDD